MNTTRYITSIVALAFCALVGTGNTQEPTKVAIIPKPQHCKITQGAPFRINNETVVSHDEGAASNAVYLAKLLRKGTGFPLKIQSGVGETNAIVLRQTPAKKELGKEGYVMSVNEKRISISASHPAGLFYGTQTLRQLLPPQLETGGQAASATQWNVPSLEIRDKPRFGWRGMLLDVGRHMFSVDAVKQQLDLLALHKMNIFHWHLTEDQGWRIEIKAYPKLTTIGAYRKQEWRDRDKDKFCGFATRNQKGNKVYGGFFTQEQVREIVAYAAERHITVMPEIDMPGHVMSALASYPELGCIGGPYKVSSKWGVKHELLCAGKEETFKFLEAVLEEVMELFPGPYIHIGGDEAPTERWKQCPLCQKKMKELGLEKEHDLQVWFADRICKFLERHNRQAVGWADFLQHSKAKNLTVMVWRGNRVERPLAEALKNNHHVIMTTGRHCYFDYNYGKISTSKVHSFNPTTDTPADKQHLIIGSQGNLWSEHIPNPGNLNSKAYPRMTALAEVLWSPLDKKRDYNEFKERTQALFNRFKIMGVRYGPL